MGERSAPVMYVTILPPGEKAIPIDVSSIVIALGVDENEKKADKIDLDLDNWDLSLFDDKSWRKGNKIQVSWGYSGNMTEPTECVIQKITGSVVLKVEALANSILMNKKHRARSFENMKRSDIAKQIAEENGYGPTLQDIEDTEVMFEHTAQARMTDAEFMKHLAQREGFQFFVDGTGFHFHRRKMGKAPIRTFEYYTDQDQGDIISFNVENDVTAVPSKVTAKGRDPLKKTDINETASNENTKRDGTAPVLEQITDFGETTLKSQAVETTILSNATDSTTAKREADGRYVNASQTVVKLSVDCIGDPRVRAKQVVIINGISRRLSGKYFINECKHNVSAQSYTQTFKCSTDGGNHLGGAKSKAAPNNKDQKNPNALTPHEDISDFGETKIRYSKDT